MKTNNSYLDGVNGPPINGKHQAFIKCYAYGHVMDEIKDICAVGDINMIKDELKKELNADGDLDIIFKAYRKGFFDIDDYFKDHLKKIAFGVALNIYMDHNKENKNHLKQIYQEVLKTYRKIMLYEQVTSIVGKLKPF